MDIYILSIINYQEWNNQKSDNRLDYIIIDFLTKADKIITLINKIEQRMECRDISQLNMQMIQGNLIFLSTLVELISSTKVEKRKMECI